MRGVRQRLTPRRRSRSSDDHLNNGTSQTDSSAVQVTPEATIGSGPEIARATQTIWVKNPQAFLALCRKLDRARGDAAAADPPVICTSACPPNNVVEETLLKDHLDRLLHATTSYPSFLGLEWNLSLDEVTWVQQYSGERLVGSDVARASSFARSKELCRPPQPPCMADDEPQDTNQLTLAWVKQSLLSMTQPPAHHPDPLNHGTVDGVGGCGGRLSQWSVQVVSVWEQLSSSSAIETGSASVDRMLHGGLQCGFVTELVGFAGAGKTSLVANWIAHATLRGVLQERSKLRLPAGGAAPSVGSIRPSSMDASFVLSGGGGCAMCVVVSVGPNLNARRMHHIVEDTVRSSDVYREALAQLSAGAPIDEERLMVDAEERIRFVSNVQSLDDLMHRVLPLLEVTPQAPDTSTKRLLVVDSFATLVHNSFDGHSCASSDPPPPRGDSLHRHNELAAVMKRLKTFAEAHRFTIILVTHAASYSQYSAKKKTTDDGIKGGVGGSTDSDGDVDLDDGIDKSNSNNDGQPHGDHLSSSCSAFGNTFFHLVNNRMVLDMVTVNGVPKRVLRIIKSPVCPPVAFELLLGQSNNGPSLLTDCVLGDEDLQRAVNALRNSGARGRGVFRMPDLKYVNVSSYLMPPAWHISL